jgi:acetolactate synthase I/III small subunit
MLCTLVAWVEDRPGVLTRVAGMFRRRGLNIESLTVGASERPGLSRMTIVVETGRLHPEIVEANLRKLIDVVDVHDVSAKPSVRRELALVKVRSDSASRTEIAQLAEIFRAKIVDVGHESVIVECSGDSEKIDGILKLLEPKGLLEIMRTGCVAMVRGHEWQRDLEIVEPVQVAKAVG